MQRLKGFAGEFFKRGNLAKAAKLYQKINGYFNFGDVANNYLKEDESCEEFKQCMVTLNGLKLICFTNLCVCKFKMKEYQSVIAITDQIMEWAPRHAKALYFRAKSQYLAEEFDSAIGTLNLLCEVEPNNTDFQAELAHAKKLKAAELKK